MPIHGLTALKRNVVRFEATRAFYQRFGLDEAAPGTFRTAIGGDQLRLDPSGSSEVTEIGIGSDAEDDLDRLHGRLAELGFECSRDGRDLVTHEPVMDVTVRVSVSTRTQQRGLLVPPRVEIDRSELVARSDVAPLRLGHVVMGCTDVPAASKLFLDGLGMRVSDHVAGGVFMRFATDHHNICLLPADRNFLHHTAWKVRSVDEVGYGARNMLDVDHERHGWGLGRHAASANYFWYLREPDGCFAEYYFSELDDLAPDDRFWDPDPNADTLPLAAWGPDIPDDFLTPPAVPSPDRQPLPGVPQPRVVAR